MQGQMHPEERDLIHRTVLDDNPTVVVECGTWYGGGSTLAAARALHAQARGRLHTWEIDPQKMSRAVSAYAEECPELLPYVRFHLGDFLSEVWRVAGMADIAILDGPENGAYTLACVKALDASDGGPHILIFHDWDRPKCRGVEDYLARSPRWRLDARLNTETGMARWVRKGRR